jgi:hypothetical protein
MNAPHCFLIQISPLVGEIKKTGEVLFRPLKVGEQASLGLPPAIGIQKDFSNLDEALLNLKKELERIYAKD